LEGAGIFRLYDLASIPVHLADSNHSRLGFFVKAKNNKDSIEQVTNFLITLDKDDWSKRIERNTLDLYTNNKSIFDQLVEKFEKDIKQVCLPKAGTENELISSESILAKKLPHGLYEYKAYLLPHRLKNKTDKKNYLNWIDNNPNILISEKVKEWFIATNWNWDRRYVFVKDGANLMLLKMRNADVLGKVYNYKIIDK
jgi:hypothetical protein